MIVIGSLEIENSKSIKHSKLDCRRINVFIGKPNTGVESNIIREFRPSFVWVLWIWLLASRFREVLLLSNLFYDENFDEAVGKSKLSTLLTESSF